MTADVELLPLPEWLAERDEKTKLVARNYARAVAEHNMAELADDRDDLLARLDASIDHGTKLGAALQRCIDEVLEQKAEIEALRAEVKEARRIAIEHADARAFADDRAIMAEARAERLAEALRGIEKELGSELVVVSGGRAYLPERTFRKALHDVRAALHPAAAQEGE